VTVFHLKTKTTKLLKSIYINKIKLRVTRISNPVAKLYNPTISAGGGVLDSF